MEINNINSEEVLSKINEIDNNIKTLDEFIEKITKKNISIKELNNTLQSKKFFDLNDSISNLEFQKSILINEKKYMKEVRRIFLEKIYNELYLLAENILMFISSIDSIEFDDKVSHESFNKRIAKIKQIKYTNLSIKNLFNLMNCININMELIKELIDLFSKYIDTTQTTITNENFHCKTFKVNLSNQKNHISVEYVKFRDQLNKIIEYYHNFSTIISKQIENQKIFEFCNNIL